MATDFIPDITTADGSPKLVWLQEAPVSVLNQILNQTHSLCINQSRLCAGRSQLNIRSNCLMIESCLKGCLLKRDECDVQAGVAPSPAAILNNIE